MCVFFFHLFSEKQQEVISDSPKDECHIALWGSEVQSLYALLQANPVSKKITETSQLHFQIKIFLFQDINISNGHLLQTELAIFLPTPPHWCFRN